MLRLLATHRVDWVMTGSTVLALYGADLTPNDLDVTPHLEPSNLQRLADALHEIEAIPAFLPDWQEDFTIDHCRAWRPVPATAEQLDYLFVTRLGMLDVPPRLCGTYDELMPSARRVDIGDCQVTVCEPDEILRRLEGRTRPKDLDRAAAYQWIRAQPSTHRRPTGVDGLLARLAHRESLS
ncbi:hypothetical protein [Nonomuraea maritima]|nr:hypothetical protein [Nonomuraea maritima]